MESILKSPEPPTAVVCFNDLVAIGALNATRAAGLRVPEDISITGWDDLPMASWEISSSRRCGNRCTRWHAPPHA